MNAENVTYFDSFGVEHVPKEVKKIIGNKYIVANVYRIQVYNSINTNLFSPNDYRKNDKIILKYFQ